VLSSGAGAKVAETGAAEGTSEGSRDRRGSPRWRLAARLAVAAFIAAIVAAYHRDLFRSLGVLGRLSWKWFVLAVAAEVGSVLAFAFSRRGLLKVSGRPPSRRAMTGITYAASAVSMSLPFAGTGLATVYSYRFLDRIASIRLPPRDYAAVFGLAVANWAADCGALALAIVATGQPVPWHSLLLAYGAGAAVGSTGLTPGGFGLVELAVAAALTAGGLSGPGRWPPSSATGS